jgi:drug/metabolite transporter (DMT)-like permease
MGIISGLISMFGWGTSDFLAAKSSRKIGFVLTFFWAQSIGFLITLLYFVFNFRTFDFNNVPKFIFIIIISGFLGTISALAFYKSLSIGKVSLVGPITASWAMITILLSVLFLKEALKTNQIAAIILIIVGVILISSDLKEFFQKNKSIFLIGAKEAIVAMFGFGVAMFLLAIVIKQLGWFLPGFLSRLFILIFLILYFIFKKQSLKTEFKPINWILIVVIGFLDIIAFFAYSMGVSTEYASIIAPVAASSPLITTVLAQVFLKEKIALSQIFGIIITISGIILISIK